mmetsp:Transcript_1477/g.4584  ORF Transcript_1477/g.4584 Transcript_1477/m.4584 type:complete len:147 (+) Transcript_1477:147-587(+)
MTTMSTIGVRVTPRASTSATTRVRTLPATIGARPRVVSREATEGDAPPTEGEGEGEGRGRRREAEVKVDPFGFGSRRQDEPDKIIPGFDTAEGGKVGPLGTAAISALLFVLFGGSFFFTSVPRDAVLELAARELADDPNAPTQSFR